ncbi:amidohydrolase family protein [Streptomyces sp. DSM 41014]|uniref:Amidohydrolase family protein n=1 Tax=Streptomyces hintoniae TaxID=3075521 RepID=A0ABU2USN3_9ACTN|nr:amidohydrolase family protein [Streptomyces sp. DSM 41014]MDT0476298.1 amidohydrolase family protein [Streptomyces sp. DSM 41014]
METLISAGQVLAGPPGQRTADGAVLLDGPLIRAVGPRSEVAPLASPDALRLAFPTATILPGLIDTHVHLAFDAGPDPVGTLLKSDDSELLTAMTGRARQLLRSGVTTVRDLGDRGGLAVSLRDTIAAGEAAGPRILTATAPLTVPGGHCWFFGGEVDGEQAIRDQVRRNIRQGADVIKVMVTGGHLTPGGSAMWESQFTEAELAAAVDEARRGGKPVAAHAHGTAGIMMSVAAGVDTIEHCTWANGKGFDEPVETARMMAQHGTHVCAAISADWRNYAAKYGKAIADRLLARVRWLEAQGVPLIAGTDAGIPDAPFDDYAGSLELFEHLGFPRERILALATTEAAGAVGLREHTGRLAPGLDADLLVVDADPLQTVAAFRAVKLVVTRGRLHDIEREGQSGACSTFGA